VVFLAEEEEEEEEEEEDEHNPSTPNPWTCSACTYKNMPVITCLCTYQFCEVCSTLRNTQNINADAVDSVKQGELDDTCLMTLLHAFYIRTNSLCKCPVPTLTVRNKNLTHKHVHQARTREGEQARSLRYEQRQALDRQTVNTGMIALAIVYGTCPSSPRWQLLNARKNTPQA
jgi:hypothetical protein